MLHEIDVNLNAHELIKIRVFSDARAERDAMLTQICDTLGAAAVQHLGKLLIVWRPAPKEEPLPPRRAHPADKSAARKAPQARRHGHTAAEEIKILILHGMLHLAGYDHERDNGRMARREERLRRQLRLPAGLISRGDNARSRSKL